MAQNLPDQDKRENGDKIHSNIIAKDFNRKDDDENGPINQDNIGNKKPSDKQLDRVLLVQDTKLTAVKNESEILNAEKPECRTTEDGLLKVLKILNLTEKYPGHLSREDMYQITKCSLIDELPKSHGELASYFIHKIVKYNYTAREFSIARSENEQASAVSADIKGSSSLPKRNRRAKEKRGLDVSPMDIIIAVFLCCDDICKQDLVSHLWSCRLAIPLVIQEKAPPILPSCFLWPLRNLVMKWETQHGGNNYVREGRLINECITSIAFIRVGDIGFSKSALINSVISVSEKTHSIFFHKDSLGSTKHRYLVDGLIDISWYFPMLKSEGKIDNHFKDAVILLNLHGDANELQRYIPVLSKLANIITVLCKVNYLDKCRQVIQSYLDMGNTVILIFTDQEIQDDDENIIQDFLESIRAGDNQLEYLEAAELQRAELVQETRSLLIKLGKEKYVCLDKVCSSEIDVTVDETTDKFLNTKKEVLAISTLLRKTPYKERKNLFLFLQGEPWIKWAEADKEKFRITNKKNDQDAQLYMAERDQTMKECRSQQREFLTKGNIRLADIFLNSKSLSNSEERKIFLRLLKFEIDDLSREDLGPIYEKYQTITHQLSGAEESEKETLKSKLKNLDNKIALCSFGLEHIMREIGQIYEALHLWEPDHPFLKHNLPELAANILLDGYPFELYDGYVNAVPIQWVTDVLRNLDNILRKQKTAVRIKVISALGIQSSGKSTMLNALFGCQYAVSAGRCTRGLYCQLIKVEETYSNELEIDYILAVDTEGLQAPELSASGQMVKHDNELATFVIGLGDLTILNLMGENTTCLNDFLPISVHAFLRMEMITHFRPKCTIVHQNVNNEDKKNLLHQGRILEENLDRMTKMACNVERTEAKLFKGIIEFDVSKDIYYLPALFEGSRPMAPISTRYSNELNILKQHLLEKDPKKQTNTLTSFINHLQNLWSAIKKDDFVYQFRNTIETEARSKLDDYWCEANWNFRQKVHNILQTGYIQIENTKDVNELDILVKTLEEKVRNVITSEHIEQKCAFSMFISKADSLLKETMTKWSVDMNKRIDDMSTELLSDMREKLRESKESRKRKFSLKDDKAKYEDTLKGQIEDLVQKVKLQGFSNLTEVKISDLFEQNWEVWKSKLLKDSPVHQTSINIENDAFDALSRAFSSGIDALRHYIQVKRLSGYDLDDFKPKEFLSTIQSLKAKIGMSPEKEIEDLARSLFHRVQIKLESRGFLRPYAKEDIEEVVQIIKDHLVSKGPGLLNAKHEVNLAVIVCGHAIKWLQGIHTEYEKQNNLANLLDKEKLHYHRIFSGLCNEAEIVSLLTTECREILKKGILHKMTQLLPGRIQTDLRKSVTMKSKSLAIYDHMINMAKEGSYDNFSLFIHDPQQSIARYISTRIDQYAQQMENPLQENFLTELKNIGDDVEQALQKSFKTGSSNFTLWHKTFCRETQDVVFLENIDRLDELGSNKEFDLGLFFKRVLQCLKNIIQEIEGEMCSYLKENNESLKNKVMKEILQNIIGCKEGCPFCGAICIVAKEGHTEEHYTTLHRPQGCKGRYYIDTNILLTKTCPESISSGERFGRFENGELKWCDHKDYKTVYPRWKITEDKTGEETSFWNYFFASYAAKIAGNNFKVPDIPPHWKGLTCTEEIEKLKRIMNK